MPAWVPPPVHPAVPPGKRAQMAARRLIGLLLVVLVVSSAGAALFAPEREAGTQPSTTAVAPTPGEADGSSGRLIEKRVQAVQASSTEPRVLSTRVGDQLELSVSARTPSEVEIPRFGLLEHATADDPARFSLLLVDAGRFAVRVSGGQIVAIVRVSEAKAGTR
jgi:hypothetical protein